MIITIPLICLALILLPLFSIPCFIFVDLLLYVSLSLLDTSQHVCISHTLHVIVDEWFSESPFRSSNFHFSPHTFHASLARSIVCNSKQGRRIKKKYETIKVYTNHRSNYWSGTMMIIIKYMRSPPQRIDWDSELERERESSTE